MTPSGLLRPATHEVAHQSDPLVRLADVHPPVLRIMALDLMRALRKRTAASGSEAADAVAAECASARAASGIFGALPTGLAVDAIVERARPIR